MKGDDMKRDFSDRMMNRFFRKVDGVKWDLMSGNIGVQTEEGIVTISGEGDDARVADGGFRRFAVDPRAFAHRREKSREVLEDAVRGG